MHWGFYMTCALKDPTHIGSPDMQSALGATRDRPVTAYTLLDTDPLWAQSSIESRVSAVFLARLHVFLLLLQMSSRPGRVLSDKDVRVLWLRLQLDPAILRDRAGHDVFLDLAVCLLIDAVQKDKDLDNEARTTMEEVRICLCARGYSSDRFYIVLDEAQEPARVYSQFYGCSGSPVDGDRVTPESFAASSVMPPGFKSLSSGALPSPPGAPSSHEVVENSLLGFVITHIGSVLTRSIIVPTGTSLTRADVVRALGREGVIASETVGSGVHMSLGGFDSYPQLERFTTKVLPPLFRERNRYLLRRAFKWLRGRYRFAVAFIAILMQSQLQYGHQLLDHLVRHCTGYMPSDGYLAVRMSSGERLLPDIAIPNATLQYALRTIVGMNYHRLERKSDIQQKFLADIAGNIFDKLIRSTDQHVVKGSDYPDTILEMGLARITWIPPGSDDAALENTGGSTGQFIAGGWSADINEPLVLLGLEQYLDSIPSGVLTSFHHFARDIKRDGNKCNGWENFVAQGFIQLFSGEKDPALDELFIFCDPGRHTELAKQTVKLVGVITDWPADVGWAAGELANARPAAQSQTGSRPREPRRPFCYIGQGSPNSARTLQWLKTLPTTFVFPDNLCGPDLIFVLQLSNGKYVWVAVQCKYHTRPSPTLTAEKDLMRQAIRSITPELFYRVRKVCTNTRSST
ncbi:hypothetical protein EV715DRAFT_262984 [Schizophyllum commune]